MSTNYYHRYSICDHCGRYDERHIGKYSMGWQFSFRAYQNEDGTILVGTCVDWLNILKMGKIFDEYGHEISYEAFVILIEESRGKKNHYDYVKTAPQYQEYGMNFLQGCYKDSDNWDFSTEEFS